MNHEIILEKVKEALIQDSIVTICGATLGLAKKGY